MKKWWRNKDNREFVRAFACAGTVVVGAILISFVVGWLTHRQNHRHAWRVIHCEFIQRYNDEGVPATYSRKWTESVCIKCSKKEFFDEADPETGRPPRLKEKK